MTAKLAQSVSDKSLSRYWKKELPRPLETVALDALPSQPATAIDLLPACIRGCESETNANQRQRLVDDEVRGDQHATGLERRITGGGQVYRRKVSMRAASAAGCCFRLG